MTGSLYQMDDYGGTEINNVRKSHPPFDCIGNSTHCSNNSVVQAACWMYLSQDYIKTAYSKGLSKLR